MTAINLVVQPSAATLLTDAAWYDHSGRLVQIHSKTTMVPAYRMAVAISGCGNPHDIAVRLEMTRNQAEAMSRLPGIVAGIRSENRLGNPAGEDTGNNDLMRFAAIWSDRSDRAEGWVISSSRAYLGAQYQPGTLVEVEHLTSPPVNLPALATFDPIRDGFALLDAQRAAQHTHGDPRSFVGGRVECTTVTRSGVAHGVLHDWQDAISGREAS